MTAPELWHLLIHTPGPNADPAVPMSTLLQTAGLASSLSEARRTVKEGGAYVNNVRVTDAEAVPAAGDWLPGGWLVLRKGRRTVVGLHRAGPGSPA